MIKTNEWTVADLAKYLVSVQSTLTEEEWDRLKMTAAFFKETDQNGGHEDQKPNRYQAHLLYEPVDVFRQLGLPVLDWGKQTKWRGSSDEGTSIGCLLCVANIRTIRCSKIFISAGLTAAPPDHYGNSSLR